MLDREGMCELESLLPLSEAMYEKAIFKIQVSIRSDQKNPQKKQYLW